MYVPFKYVAWFVLNTNTNSRTSVNSLPSWEKYEVSFRQTWGSISTKCVFQFHTNICFNFFLICFNYICVIISYKYVFQFLPHMCFNFMQIYVLNFIQICVSISYKHMCFNFIQKCVLLSYRYMVKFHTNMWLNFRQMWRS